MSETCTGEPQFGYAVVRMHKQDKSAGGIIVPETAEQGEMVRYFVAASSEGFLDHGTFIPSTLQSGDEVVLAPNGTRKIVTQDKPGGKPIERTIGVHRLLQSPLLPAEHYIVLLSDVAYRVPKEHVQPVVGEAPRVKLVEAGTRH